MDIDELVAAFGAGEDANLTLFNYVTEVGCLHVCACRLACMRREAAGGCSQPAGVCADMCS